jgi:hypothetical protein
VIQLLLLLLLLLSNPGLPQVCSWHTQHLLLRRLVWGWQHERLHLLHCWSAACVA